jgi:hypothetical protein
MILLGFFCLATAFRPNFSKFSNQHADYKGKNLKFLSSTSLSAEVNVNTVNTNEGVAKKSDLVVFLTNTLNSYSELLEKHPYRTKVISSGIIGALGDILIQLWKIKQNSLYKFDYRRLLVFSTVAGLYIAPVINVWFNWLNKFPIPKSFNNVGKALVMMVLDQTIGAVVVTTGFFYAFELVISTLHRIKF